MLKTSTTCLFLAITLQFAATSGAHAFESAIRGDLGYGTTLNTYQLSQNGRGNLRSRSDVIQEVKQRYNAEILKISLDDRKQVYRVRVLMPNGKVRNLQISARR